MKSGTGWRKRLSPSLPSMGTCIFIFLIVHPRIRRSMRYGQRMLKSKAWFRVDEPWNPSSSRKWVNDVQAGRLPRYVSGIFSEQDVPLLFYCRVSDCRLHWPGAEYGCCERRHARRYVLRKRTSGSRIYRETVGGELPGGPSDGDRKLRLLHVVDGHVDAVSSTAAERQRGSFALPSNSPVAAR